MTNNNTQIYQDIAKRSSGDIYIGVVGPVRAGKSTFIKRFMETQVIPNIDNVYRRERAKDELPQSGSGRMVMTAEPKFVPEEAVDIALGDGATCSVRLIDCVGYMVPGATGDTDGESPRMVSTPWSEHELSMAQAAELGTSRVIREHSTIGVVVTTDGSITDIPREAYLEAEGRVIRELQEIGKPFLVLLNAADPASERVQAMAEDIAQTYGVTCLPVNCLTLDDAAVEEILKAILYEFPLTELDIRIPAWVEALDAAHPIKCGLYRTIRESAEHLRHIREVGSAVKAMGEFEDISEAKVTSIQLGSGTAEAELQLPRALFYQTLSEQSGFPVSDDGDLLELLTQLSSVKSEYDKVAQALRDARETGYGIVVPSVDELDLEEPEIMKQGGRYGVRLKASAPSIHMIRADIETTVSPIVGNEKQSEEMVNYLLQEFEGDTAKIWQSNIFGRSFHEIVNEDLQSKLKRVPEDARKKLRETLERIINEGGGGLICIIL
ncbi:MAG: stage IV sporulation protein A [Ruminococcaceae bacterium]|nr:stage IV sporulation protein A [Oscillospiraceae bacterium]